MNKRIELGLSDIILKHGFIPFGKFVFNDIMIIRVFCPNSLDFGIRILKR